MDQQVIFQIGYMAENERQAMEETPKLGCWHCGKKECYLTHKYDDYSKAKFKERDPYRK